VAGFCVCVEGSWITGVLTIVLFVFECDKCKQRSQSRFGCRDTTFNENNFLSRQSDVAPYMHVHKYT
jgi:hypothetical protein